jgi:hypothetical protein
MLHNGEIPDGLFVLHNCPDGDNPRCVNPEHLWLGTLRDNNLDMCRKGRHGITKGMLAGENNPCSKLTTSQVMEILKRLKNGETQISLAAVFGVHPSMISLIHSRKKWAHIQLPEKT